MKPVYRLTGAVMGLIAGGFVALLFSAGGSMAFGAAIAPWRPLFFLMLVPLVLLGYTFDSLPVRRFLARLARPGYLTSALYWMAAFPFVKLTNDLLLAIYFPLFAGTRFLWPPYLTTLGMDGLTGFFIYQSVVGLAFGIGFFMGYERVFVALARLDGWYTARHPAGRRRARRGNE